MAVLNDWAHGLRALGLAALAVPPLMLPAGAQAGQLIFDEGDSNGCDLRFTGQVEAGDLEQFQSVVPGFYEGTLCLDSPGGSFPEALDIADFLLSEWETVATRIKPGARCESACALIFLAGKTFEETETLSIWFDRSIEPGGKLGFHAPSLGLPAGTSYSSEHVTKGFGLALEAARRAFEMSMVEDFSDPAAYQYASPYVMARFLGTPPQEMYYIDTVGDALLARIPAGGFDARVTTDEALIRTICDNVYMQREEGFGYGLNGQWKPSKFANAKDVYRVFQALDFKKNNGLEVHGSSGQRVFSPARTYIESTGQQLIGYATGYPDYYIGEAVCLVSISTSTQPGDALSHYDMDENASTTKYDFETGFALRVWVQQSYDKDRDHADMLARLRQDDPDFMDDLTSAAYSPLVLFPWDMKLADLPRVRHEETPVQNAAGLSCDALWHRRNQIFHENGYCFGGPRGIAAFGNEGCFTKNPALSASEAREISQIKQMERDKGC